MNSFSVKSLAVAAALLAGAATSAQAQDLKIGYVNSDRVLREAVPAKAAQAKLDGLDMMRTTLLGRAEGEPTAEALRLQLDARGLDRAATIAASFSAI